MAARGDLLALEGFLVGLEVPFTSRRLVIKQRNDALQSLSSLQLTFDSMIRNPGPTCAEVTDANAIYDGTDQNMLGESA